MQLSSLATARTAAATPAGLAERFAPQFAGLGAKTSVVGDALRLSFPSPFDAASASATLRDTVDGAKLQFFADTPTHIGGKDLPGIGFGGGGSVVPELAQQFLLKLPDTAVGFGAGQSLAVLAQTQDAFAAARALVRPEINGKPTRIEFIGIAKPQGIGDPSA